MNDEINSFLFSKNVNVNEFIFSVNVPNIESIYTHEISIETILKYFGESLSQYSLIFN